MDALSDLERHVVDTVAARERELVELVSALIGFDTVTHAVGDAPREEEALQAFLADRLRSRGASVEVTVPRAELVAGHVMTPDGFDFGGRPQLVARFRGRGGGRSLLFNGHVDVVAADPRSDWTSDPFDAAVRDGAIWGRGACDMKGGVGCMVLAAEVLADLGVPLAGDLLVNTVTEEESTGLGGLVSARTLQADGAIVPEPSGLAVWICCRGSLLPAIHVEGRAGHAGIAPKHHAEGGAVNAIEKASYLVEAVRRLREEWSLLPRHPYLSPPDCVPTMIQGGEWLVSYPARCRLDCHIEFLPSQADERGWGTRVRAEFEDWIARAAAADPWLRDHPPRVEWLVGEVPAAEVAADDPLVTTLVGAEHDLGRAAPLGGLDNWHDGATLTVEAGIPAVCFGPGDIHRAHAVDEHVPIVDLVACAQGLALAAMRYCGTAG